MTINTGSIIRELRPGLAYVLSSMPIYPPQWSDIYEVYDSDKHAEIEIENRMLGLAQFRAEGAPTAMDTMGERIVTNYVHKTIGLGFIITRMAIMDNLYKTKFPMMTKSLKNSLATTKNILGAGPLNTAFDANFPIGDGQSLCSTSHPIDGGIVANKPTTDVDLSEAAIEAALVGISQFKDQAGLPLQIKAKKLIVSASNDFQANRLLNSVFRVGTANNDISAIYNMSSVPEGHKVNNFLNRPNAWFLLTDADNGFKHFVREPVEIDVYTDMDTDNIKCKAVERYSFGVSNFRAVYGSSGA